MAEDFFASYPELGIFLKIEPPVPLQRIEPLGAPSETPDGALLTYSDGEKTFQFCVVPESMKGSFAECTGLDRIYLAAPEVSVFGISTDSNDGNGFFDDWVSNPLLDG